MLGGHVACVYKGLVVEHRHTHNNLINPHRLRARVHTCEMAASRTRALLMGIIVQCRYNRIARSEGCAQAKKAPLALFNWVTCALFAVPMKASNVENRKVSAGERARACVNEIAPAIVSQAANPTRIWRVRPKTPRASPPRSSQPTKYTRTRTHT